MEPINIDGVYVVHAKKGYEIHEKRVNELFKKHALSFEFMTDGDPSVMTISQLQKYFSSDIKSLLSIGVLSCTLNHILSYEQIAKKGIQWALVFENDPYFENNFNENLNKVIKEAKTLPPGFIISLENSTLKFPSHKIIKKGKYLYEAQQGRMAGAYLVDLKGAKNMLADLQSNKCAQVIDWWHNGMIDRNVVKMYWAHPTLTEQGSHNGLQSATISTKNKGLQRRISWLAQKYYKTYITRHFK